MSKKKSSIGGYSVSLAQETRTVLWKVQEHFRINISKHFYHKTTGPPGKDLARTRCSFPIYVLIRQIILNGTLPTDPESKLLELLDTQVRGDFFRFKITRVLFQKPSCPQVSCNTKTFSERVIFECIPHLVTVTTRIVTFFSRESLLYIPLFETVTGWGQIQGNFQ